MWLCQVNPRFYSEPRKDIYDIFKCQFVFSVGPPRNPIHMSGETRGADHKVLFQDKTFHAED